jgi:hypothetical protein
MRATRQLSEMPDARVGKERLAVGKGGSATSRMAREGTAPELNVLRKKRKNFYRYSCFSEKSALEIPPRAAG